MRLIRPTNITDAMLISCDVPETDYSPYAAGTTYAEGDTVMVIADHRVYESLQSGNLGHTPVSSPEWWLDISATNRWQMFDAVVGSQTEQAESFSVTLAPGLVDSLALLDLDATTVTVTLTDPVEGQVYSETIDLSMQSYINNAWDYFFEPIILDDTVVLLGLPPYGAAQIEITISNPGDTAKLGTLIVGPQKDLGLTRYQPSIGIVDYSKKEVDAFGNYVVVKRAFSKKMSTQMMIENTYVDFLHRTLAEYRATPVCWVGADAGFSSMVIYGFYKSFDILIEGPETSTCNLEVEGLS
jgi:hypothetical protein